MECSFAALPAAQRLRCSVAGFGLAGLQGAGASGRRGFRAPGLQGAGASGQRSAAYEAGDRVGRLADLLLGLGAAPLRGLDHAVGQVLLEQLQGEGLQRLRGGRDLSEDVDAVLVLVYHPLQAADLALDPAQPLEVAVLPGAVTMDSV